MLFVIAIMQTFTGAAYLGKNLVRDQSGQACQHGNTHQMKQHRFTLSGVSPLQECDTFKVAGARNLARKFVLSRTF